MATAPQNNTDTAAVRRGRRTLIVLTLVFAVPVVLAYVLHVSGWRPQGRSVHYGELIEPARPLPEATLRAADGVTVPFSALRRHWLLLYVGRLPCGDACRAAVDKMERVRLAQGKEMRRVELVFVVLDGAAEEMQQLAGQHPVLKVLGGERPAVEQLARALVSSEGTALDGGGRLYLVDPIGNLVLSYRADADARGLHKDLARLLRLSQVG